tara:strand:- start:9492 stop:9950 length:459 start_codon:yes stop_codon:yes gene_type:complete
MSYIYDEALFSDLYKDVNGFRPRNHEFYSATPERKEEIWLSLVNEAADALTESEAMDRRNVEKFDNDIKKLIETGAKDRDEAIRWYVDSLDLSDDDLMYGGEYICHVAGLPYSMTAIFNEALGNNDPDPERAAIMEYDGGLTREEADRAATV